MKRLISALCSAVFLTLMSPTPSWAVVENYRGEAEISVQHSTDYDLGLFLAKMVAFERALEDTRPFLSTQKFLKNQNISETDWYVLSHLLATHTLNYQSDASTPQKAIYKVKMRYDSLKFPDNFLKYKSESLDRWIQLMYQRQHNEALKQKVLDYLRLRNPIQNPQELELLEIKRGKALRQEIEADQRFDKALLYFNSNKREEGMQLLDKVIAENPDYPLYTLEKITFLLKLNEEKKQPEYLEESIQLTSQLIQSHPQEPYFFLLRGVLYSQQGIVPREGLKDIKEAIRLKKTPPDSVDLVLLGLLAYQSNDIYLYNESMKRACELGLESACK